MFGHDSALFIGIGLLQARDVARAENQLDLISFAYVVIALEMC